MEIQQKTGLNQLGRLDHDDKVELLALVESDTSPENPLWSTLLAAAGDDARLRLHRDVSNVSAQAADALVRRGSPASRGGGPGGGGGQLLGDGAASFGRESSRERTRWVPAR
ncbi:hypothetical protein ACQ4WX_50920 [Streptomyces lasalocidi]